MSASPRIRESKGQIPKNSKNYFDNVLKEKTNIINSGQYSLFATQNSTNQGRVATKPFDKNDKPE